MDDAGSHFKVMRRLQHHFASHLLGLRKPDPKIYEAAMAIAARPPAEILLVDDSRANVMAAERLGWHVLWFDDYRPDESVTRIRTTLEVIEDSPTP